MNSFLFKEQVKKMWTRFQGGTNSPERSSTLEIVFWPTFYLEVMFWPARKELRSDLFSTWKLCSDLNTSWELCSDLHSTWKSVLHPSWEIFSDLHSTWKLCSYLHSSWELCSDLRSCWELCVLTCTLRGNCASLSWHWCPDCWLTVRRINSAE